MTYRAGMTTINCPNCGHHIFNLDSNLPGQSAGATSSPPAAVPSGNHDCPNGHGPMPWKEGISKAGNSYKGWFCTFDGCDGKVWAPKPK